MTNETTLLSCPFCGGEATVERIGKSGYYYVACNTAYCCDFGKFDTEAEAIAEWNTRAELGSDREKAKSHPYGYERDTGAYDCTRCECGCINDISAKYCNDCGGEIEIDESAEKEYYDGYSKHTVFAKKHDDGSLEFCERRYVPEESVAHGTLTAEQVRDAIFNGSSYASYDGSQYYANGIDMKAIADELNAELGKKVSDGE